MRQGLQSVLLAGSNIRHNPSIFISKVDWRGRVTLPPDQGQPALTLFRGWYGPAIIAIRLILVVRDLLLCDSAMGRTVHSYFLAGFAHV
jgi:hypothetical protein